MYKKIMSLGLALAMILVAVPAFAFAQEDMMDEWNQPIDMSGAKGSMYTGWAELSSTPSPSAHGGSVSKNFDTNEGWTNVNPQGPGRGSADDNFDKASDWK